MACCTPLQQRPGEQCGLGARYKMDPILTVNEVAKLIKVKPITVREMFRNGRLRGFKVGKAWRTTEKMLQEDIEALASGRAPAKLDQQAATPTPAPPPEAAPVIAPKKKASKPRKNPAKPDPDEKVSKVDDDTQQLLF